MQLEWTKGLKAQEKEDLVKEYHMSAVLRARMHKILLNRIKLSQTKNTSELSYDNPNWALKQADAVGYQRALNDLISLISDKTV